MPMNDVNFEALFEAYESQSPVSAKVIERQETGFKVNLFGLEAYMPGSEAMDKNAVREGDDLEVQIVKMNPGRNNIVVSNRAAVGERMVKEREAMLDSMEVGQILNGRVKSIADYGVFVSVGPVDGLVYIQDVSWERFTNIRDVVQEGDDVKVKVMSITEKKGKRLLSLSIKEATDNPWNLVNPKDYEGTVVEGEVVSISPAGAFVKVGQLQGLLHKSEISWGKVADPKEFFTVGQTIEAMVVSVNVEKRQMALSMKALHADPWNQYISDEIIGESYMGTVTKILAFGLLVEIFPDVEALLHKNSLPKEVRKLANFGGFYSVGDTIPVKVKTIDEVKRKITLDLSNEEDVKSEVMHEERILQAKPIEQDMPDSSPATSAGVVSSAQAVPAPATPKQVELADFLYKFSEDDGFKFLTHDIKTAGIDLIDYIDLCKGRLMDWKRRHEIPEELFQLIRGFIFGKGWTGYDGEEHAVYCTSDDWVDYYDENNEHPMLGDQFSGEVDIFRNSIRWRSGKLEKYLFSLKEKYPRLQIDIDRSVKGADFYTYTRNIRLAIEEILSSMQDFAEGHNIVHVGFQQEDLSDGYFRAVLTFEQEGSFPSHDFERDRRKLESGGGTMDNIKNALEGYADWAVESKWLDQEAPSRWTILGETSGTEPIPSAKGFKHIISIVHKDSDL